MSVRPMLLAIAILAAYASPALAYDGHNDRTLGDTPYASAVTFAAPPQTFNNAAFGEAAEFSAGATSYTGCGAWGARTGWVRFATATAGRVFVSVESAGTPAYDVMYKVYTAPSSIPIGSASLTDMTPAPGDCQNANHGTPNENYVFGYAIPRDRVVYVQTLSVCADRTNLPPCSTQERADAPGGPTTINFRFTPDNRDGDAAPDSLDACPGDSGPVSGCPDEDQDGVGDPFDHCLGVPGKGADGCRLPDEDGDGFASTSTDKRTRDCNDDVREINPKAREVLGNDVDENCDGLAAFDRDGDRSEDKPGPDCDPTNRKIHPGAREIRGNKIDEDCDKSDAPFLRVTSQVVPGYLQDSRDRVRGFQNFKVVPVVKGMQIRLECRGRGCPYSTKLFRAKRTRRSQTVGREFNGRALPVGARVTVKVLRKGYVGRAIRFTIKRGAGDPRIIKRCLLPGRTALRKKC